MKAAWVGLMVGASAALACCTRHKEPPRSDGVLPVVSAPAPLPAPDPHQVPPLAASNLTPATRPACRAKSLKGGATVRTSSADPPRPLVQGELLNEESRVDLAADTELSLQATISTREIAVRGPATLAACPDGEEAVRLTVGRISGYPAMGVRPGSDVWIATPLGVVRFSDAQIDLDLSSPVGERLEVKLAGGRASFMPAAGVRVAGSPDAGALDEVPIPGTGAFSADRPAMPLPKLMRDLVAACRAEAEAAHDAGARVLESNSAGDPGQLGQRAFAHVRARQRARAACEVAHAAEALKPSVLDSSMRAQLAASDAKWKSSLAPPSLTPLPTRR